MQRNLKIYRSFEELISSVQMKFVAKKFKAGRYTKPKSIKVCDTMKEAQSKAINKNNIVIEKRLRKI